MYKIATWNINSIRVRLPHILEWLNKVSPDILALQELKVIDEGFPLLEIENAGYHAVFSCQKTYNGVALLSKQPASEVVKDIPSLNDPQRRILAATINNIRILNLYIPNGESVDSDKYQYKLHWLKQLHDYIANERTRYDRFIILGDFNIAPEPIDVYDPKLWEGKVLFSLQERQAYAEILQLGFQDSFRLFEQGQYFTWWDYRAAAFRRNLGMRIDHILVNDAFATDCKHCFIDKEPRKWDRPSDHTPIIAEFAL